MRFEFAFLDIGHGDCTVITFPERGRLFCIVVDGGQTQKAARRLATYLKATGAETIDLLVVTHIDADHIGGIIQLLKHESNGARDWNRGVERCIRRYWGPLPSRTWAGTERVPESIEREVTLGARSFVMESVAQNQELAQLLEQRLEPGGASYPSLEDPPAQPFTNLHIELLSPDIQVPDAEIEAVALDSGLLIPAPGEMLPSTVAELERIVAARAEEAARIADRNANNQSIVFRAAPRTEAGELSQWSFLLTGDAEEEAWQMMRGHPEVAQRLPTAVLKLPHHGSALNGIDKESFDLISPTRCVNSSGQKHGLPDTETLNLVRNNERSELFCTERNNNRAKQGPCLAKDRCPRRTEARYKSVRFTVDTATDSCQVRAFNIDVARSQVRDVLRDVIWCPETSWN
jgi:hypothetical protein